MSSYLLFEPQPAAGKTTIMRVVSKSSSDVLGTIRWYGAWRQYVFYPSAGTLFSAGCMEDINAVIRELMDARR
jgi:hypothetical protein